MKNHKLLFAFAVAGAMMASCADEFDVDNYVVNRPGDIEQYEYLKDYAPLKTYLDRTANPDLKIGAALTASDFNNKGNVFTLAVANVDEVVAGNAMKMASIVNDKGDFNFGTVQNFVQAAEDAGLTIFGHTLAWHAQQPTKWLNKLLADKPMPKPDGPTTVQEEVVFTSAPYEDGPFPFYPMGCQPPIIDGAIHFEPTGEWSQFFIKDGGVALDEGNYAVVLTIKSNLEGTIKLTVQNGWEGDAQQLDGNVKLSGGDDFEEVLIKYNGLVGGNYDLILKPETFGAVIDLKGFKIIKYNEISTGGPATHIERKLVKEVTYTDGPFPFYPMGCEPPVIDNAIHFEPTGDWSQFFISGAIGLEEGNYVFVLRMKSTLEGTIKLTVQNGWGGDAQQLDGNVKLSGGDDYEDIEITYNDLVGGNYDPILKPETFGGTLDIQSLKVYKLEEVVGPTPKEVAKVTYTDGPFPFYPMGCEPPVINNAIHFEPTGDWSQFFISSAIGLEEGNYSFVLRIKSSKEGTIKLTVQNGWGGDAQQLDGNVKLSGCNDFEDVEIKYDGIVGGNYDPILKPETFDGVLDIQSLTVIKWEEPVETGNTVEKKITENKPTIVITTQDKVSDPWDSQFWIRTTNPYSNGQSFEFSMDVRADIKSRVSTQNHKEPAEWTAGAGLGDITFETEWGTYTKSGTLDADGHSFAFNLNEQASGTKYYIRNIKLLINGQPAITNGDLSTDDVSCFIVKEYPATTTSNATISPSITYSVWVDSNTIPLTEEEKRDTVTYAFKKWINGMMDATEGKVKAWDLVNEAISGTPGDDGFYALQHESQDDNDFFWQNYLGDIDYVVIAEKTAREAYARQENNTGDLKLFINDYNLESDWDHNQKAKSLVNWIAKWEAAGAKIDGIGTQMHVSLYENEEIQQSKKEAITAMFEILANSGKLVRISELDMGIVDKAGKTVKNDQMTFEREKAMADFYQWIIEEYFRVVPAAQRYGITQWCITDSAKGSGWREDEPVGLWYRDYTRKPAYAGWAEGLKNAK